MGTVHVDERGRGPVVLLLHDTPCRPEHMRLLGDRLADKFRVLIVHRPGHGRSAPLEPYSLERSLSAIEEALEVRRIRDVHLVGYGVGGYLAFALAARAGVRAQSVTCLGGTASFDTRQRERMSAWASMLRDGTDLRHIIEGVTLSPRGRESLEARADVRSWVDVAHDGLARELEALISASGLYQSIARACVPILVRVGSIDAASPPELAQHIADYGAHVTYEEVPGVGHALLWEDLEATSESVERHLLAAAQSQAHSLHPR